MKKSLSRQIITCVVSAVILCCCIFNMLNIVQIISASTAQMRVDGRTLINLVERQVTQYSFREAGQLQETIREIVQGSKGDLEYIAILDEEKNILLSDTREYIEGENYGQAIAPVRGRKIIFEEDEITGFVYYNEAAERVYNVSMPVLIEQEQYILNIGISLVKLHEVLKRNILSTVIFSIIITAVSCIICLYLCRRMTRTLSSIQEGMERIENNDLTGSIEVKNKNELGQVADTVNHMRDSLLQMIKAIALTSKEMSEGAGRLSSETEEAVKASREISSSAQEINCIIENQNEDISNIYDDLEAISSKLEDSMLYTNQVVEHNRAINQLVRKGFGNIEDLIQSFYDIKSLFDNGLKQIETLHQSVDQISEMTSVINNVAEQTNLLSLNAAIEAARAGEAGRGFAVVASEIRKLSDQVKTSSAHINKMVEDVKGNMDEVIIRNDGIVSKMQSQSASIEQNMNGYKSLKELNRENDRYIMTLEETIKKLVEDKKELMSQVEQLKNMSENITMSTQEITASIVGQTDNIESVNQFTGYLGEVVDRLEATVVRFKI